MKMKSFFTPLVFLNRRSLIVAIFGHQSSEESIKMSLHKPGVYHKPYATIQYREDEIHSKRKNIHHAG
jgi:hypothetical protein